MLGIVPSDVAPSKIKAFAKQSSSGVGGGGGVSLRVHNSWTVSRFLIVPFFFLIFPVPFKVYVPVLILLCVILFLAVLLFSADPG